MSGLIDLYGFIAVLVRGFTLALEAITIGGIFFLLFVHPSEPEVEARCRTFVRIFAFALAIVAICGAILSALILFATGGGTSFGTAFLNAAMLIAAGAAAIAILASHVPVLWLLLPAAAILAGSLLTSHAHGRVDGRGVLFTFTGLHHLATAAWIGGMPYLIVALGRGRKHYALLTARRFSRLAMFSVAALVAAGCALAWIYVGNVEGMYATSYGLMLAAKIALLGMLLALGGSNFLLLRGNVAQAVARMPVLKSVEVEAAVGIVAILAAASLTSQPPAADLTENRVSPREIAERFVPQWPNWTTPPLSSLSPATPLNQQEAERFGRPISYTPGSKYSPDKPEDIAWSEYNHHWSGLCVLAMGVLALIAQTRWAKTRWGSWARHWPLAFLGLALFLLIRSDSENWPLGPRGFWESFQVAEVAQHRVFVVMIVAFAIFEWRVATGRNGRSWYALVFPAICMTGGALLLTHTHPLGNIKQELLAEMSHTPIGLLAVTAAGSRWLELRLPKPPAFLGFVWAPAFIMIGLLLIGYRER